MTEIKVFTKKFKIAMLSFDHQTKYYENHKFF